jgi:hypothetical protein
VGDIRACAREDIPAVARIFQNAFRNQDVPAPRSLELCLQELLFDHPWHDPELPSRVFVTPEGQVGGFIGVVPLHMSFRGRKLRAAVPTSLSVGEPGKYPLAGARLLRSFLGGPQDLSIAEPVNAVSQNLLLRLGAQSVASESMEWLRVLRPAGTALAMLGDRWGTRFATPLFRIADRAAQRVMPHAFKVELSPSSFAHDADVSDEALLDVLPALAEGYALRPDWDLPAFKFVLRHAGENSARGTLYRRLVYDRNMKPLGCYVYHGRKGRVAFVLQVIAREGGHGPVLDSLIAHAAGIGSVALKGRTERRLLDPLLQRGAFFFRRHSAMVHSRDPELVEAVRGGKAMTSGLAAESWMRLCADRFS